VLTAALAGLMLLAPAPLRGQDRAEPPAAEPPSTEPPATQRPAAVPLVAEPPATEPPATAPPAAERDATKPPAADPPPKETRPQDGSTTDAPPGPSLDAPPAAPAQALVIGVGGVAEFGPAGASALERDRWTAVEVGMMLSADVQIMTGLRGFVQLSFDGETFVEIERLSLVRIDQYVRSASEQTIRIDLRYGAVHGGSTELRFRSNLTVASPVATMAKRGTDGWRFASEAQTGRFQISLARHGLVEALQRLSGDRVVSRLILPGEYANVANIAGMWLKQDIFDRAVKFVKPYAVSESDMTFAVRHSTTGLAYAATGDVDTLEAMAGGRRTTVTALPRVFSGLAATTVRRPEGNFGTTPAR